MAELNVKIKMDGKMVVLEGILSRESCVLLYEQVRKFKLQTTFVDISELSQMDGSGLAVLSTWAQTLARRNKTMYLFGAWGQPRRMLKHLDMNRAMNMILLEDFTNEINWNIPAVAFTKRVMDIFISTITLTVLSPILLLVALAIKLDSKGPVFYRQKRVKAFNHEDFNIPGKSKRQADLFNMLKFRTMREDAEKETGAVNAGYDDPRVTRVGRFLRPTRIDEIPNLLNVLRGDMSIVGPRADRPEIFEQVEHEFPFIWERTRYVKPGITGLAQLELRSNGDMTDNKKLPFVLPESDVDKDTLSFRYKLYYDFTYGMVLTDFWKFLSMDVKIIAKTPIVMFIRRNVI